MATAPEIRWRRRTEGLHVEALADSTLAYDTGTDEVHCLGATATLVWDACSERRTADELATATGLTTAAVDEAIAALAERGLLEDATQPTGMTRRRFGIAAAGAVGAGLVWSIAAPTPAMAASDGGPVDPPLDQYLAVANLQLYSATSPEVSLTIRNLSTTTAWSVAGNAMTITVTISEPGGYDTDPGRSNGDYAQGGGMGNTFISTLLNGTVAKAVNSARAFTLAPGEVLTEPFDQEVFDMGWLGSVPPGPRTGTITARIDYTLVGDPTPRSDTQTIPWPIP